LSGQWYIGFHHNEESNYNKFQLKRAYITYWKEITPWLSGRITPDITIDTEGNDRGDIELKMKYLFVSFNIKDLGVFTNNTMNIGLIPRPWIDFEQGLVQYRAQGRMFMERINVINSTDYGISFNSLIGGKFDNKDFSSASDGKYGDFSIGIFNGGGYSAIEENRNKTAEWRFTFRPSPESFPGFIASYHGAYGNGNSISSYKFQYNALEVII
jgi:hypothetical protein